MAIARDAALLEQAGRLIAADLTAATARPWRIAIAADLAVTAACDGRTVTGAIGRDLVEDEWEWDDLDAEMLPTTLWHDATEAVWDVVDGGFLCWAAAIPACPRDAAAPLVLISGVWTCRAHAHDVAAVGGLAAELHP